jgi:hypothetical protein
MPDGKESAKTLLIEIVKSDGFVKVYANSAQIDTGPWDFRIIFGEAVRSGDKLIVEQSVAVVMSPQHAKAFLGVLGNNVRQYEKQIAEINIPPEEPTTTPPAPNVKN